MPQKSVFSYRYLVRQGFKFDRYRYQNLPNGWRVVKLEMKCWKRKVGISCFFLDLESRETYQVGVFPNELQEYIVNTVDVAGVALGSVMRISIVKTWRSHRLESIELLAS